MQFGFKNYKIIKNERNFTGSKPRSSSSSSEAFLLYNKACPNEPTRQQSQNKAFEIVSRKTHIQFITLHYSLTLFSFVSSSSKSSQSQVSCCIIAYHSLNWSIWVFVSDYFSLFFGLHYVRIAMMYTCTAV